MDGSGIRSNRFDNPLPGVPDVESHFFCCLLAAKDLTEDEKRIARDVHV